MFEKKRRDFICSLVASTMSGAAIAYTQPLFFHNNTIDNTKADEYKRVYQAWIQAEHGEPIEYLKNRGVHDLNNSLLIRSLSIIDFENGFTITVNGFVLSLAEAAVMASFSQSSLNSIKL